MPTPDQPIDEQYLIEHYSLEPIPDEGGLFTQVWQGEFSGDHPTGTAIVVLLSNRIGAFSALHRLPTDEVWHFYLGDPIEILLLKADGSSTVLTLGHELAHGHQVAAVVPAGTWFGASVAPDGEWGLAGCTMAPGFVPQDYEGAERAVLISTYPDETDRIVSLTRG